MGDEKVQEPAMLQHSRSVISVACGEHRGAGGLREDVALDGAVGRSQRVGTEAGVEAVHEEVESYRSKWVTLSNRGQDLKVLREAAVCTNPAGSPSEHM